MAVANETYHPAQSRYEVVALGASATVQGWPNYLADDLGPLCSMVNKGVNGNRTDQMLARINPDVLALYPGYCTVDGGSNDCVQDRSAASIEANLLAIYTTLLGAGIIPIPLTIFPFGSSAVYTPARDAVRLAANAWIMASGLPATNIDPLIGQGSGPVILNPAYDSGDGVHPNQAGYDVVGDGVFASGFSSRMFV